MALTGKHKLSERDGAPVIGYWRFEEHAKKNRTFADLALAYHAALGAGEQVKEHVAKLSTDEMLSDQGRKAEVAKFAVETALPRIVRDKLAATARVRRDVKARMDKMSPVNIDRADLMAEMQRRELRDALRAMPQDKRDRLIEHGGDEALIDAVLAATPMLSGVSEGVLVMARERRLDQRFGDERRALSELIDAAETVERAFDAVKEEIQHSTGMTSVEFKQVVKPIEQAAADEFRKTFDRERANDQPLQNVAELAEAIKALPFQDRSKMIDLALERQIAEVHGEKTANALYPKTDAVAA